MNIYPQVPTTTDGKEHLTDLVSYELIKKRIVYLFDEVNNESAQSVITQLKYLASKSNRPICLIINSPGGLVSSGTAIYDVMKMLECNIEIYTLGIGKACSMGAFLLAAGSPGKRYASERCELLIHQPLGGAQGQATDISVVAEHIQAVKTMLANLLADNCGRDLSEQMERDYWMSAAQALEMGLVDHIGLPFDFI